MLSDLDIIKVYYTMFGRAPDLEGFNYWRQEAATQGWDIADLVNRFLELPIVQEAGYAPQQSDSDYITKLYANLFGKAPDDGGYWQGRLDQGLSRGDLLGQMVQAALGTPEGTPGKGTVLNKLSFSQYIVDLQAANGISLDAADLAGWTDTVGEDGHSVVQAVGDLKAQVEAQLGIMLQYQFDPTVQNPGQDPLYDSLQSRISALIDILIETFAPGEGNPDDDAVSFSGLLPALQQQGMLEFSDSIWANMRDNGADLDRDGRVELQGESLIDNSLTLTGLNYLLQVATRMTEADASRAETIYNQVSTSLGNPEAVTGLTGQITGLYNEISIRQEQQTPVTQSMQDEMADVYLGVIGMMKQMQDYYGIDIPVML